MACFSDEIEPHRYQDFSAVALCVMENTSKVAAGPARN
jgi:hypothetical protein